MSLPAGRPLRVRGADGFVDGFADGFDYDLWMGLPHDLRDQHRLSMRLSDTPVRKLRL